MTVPRLTKPNLLQTPKLRKIAFEEHFLVPEGMDVDANGKVSQKDIDYRAVTPASLILKAMLIQNSITKSPIIGGLPV